MVVGGDKVEVVMSGLKPSEVQRAREIEQAITSLRRVAYFSRAQGQVRIEIHAAQHYLTLSYGEIHCEILLDDAELVARVKAYHDVCCGLERQSLGLSRGDIYRSQLHNRGAELVGARCAELEPDVPTARRLFSLVVALSYSPPPHTP